MQNKIGPIFLNIGVGFNIGTCEQGVTIEPIFLGRFLRSEPFLGLGQCERTVRLNEAVPVKRTCYDWYKIGISIQTYYKPPLMPPHIHLRQLVGSVQEYLHPTCRTLNGSYSHNQGDGCPCSGTAA